jgi:hypothetical protein
MKIFVLQSYLSAIFITLRNLLAELLRSSSQLRHTTKSSYTQAIAALWYSSVEYRLSNNQLSAMTAATKSNQHTIFKHGMIHLSSKVEN